MGLAGRCRGGPRGPPHHYDLSEKDRVNAGSLAVETPVKRLTETAGNRSSPIQPMLVIRLVSRNEYSVPQNSSGLKGAAEAAPHHHHP